MDKIDFKIPNGELILYENFFSEEESKELYHKIYEQVNWELRQLFMFGRWVDQPRLTALYGDDNKEYSYTGTTWKTHKWIDPLIIVKDRVQEVVERKINAVLCNLYRDGKDGCGWHSDAGKSDGKNPQIYSVSFGATRIFQLKHRFLEGEHSKPMNIPLTSGSLLIMGGELQHHWLHAVPKCLIATPPRINLTFRTVLT